MGLRNYVAILIEDFNMAQVLGRPEYVTGMIRTPDGGGYGLTGGRTRFSASGSPLRMSRGTPGRCNPRV